MKVYNRPKRIVIYLTKESTDFLYSTKSIENDYITIDSYQHIPPIPLRESGELLESTTFDWVFPNVNKVRFKHTEVNVDALNTYLRQFCSQIKILYVNNL